MKRGTVLAPDTTPSLVSKLSAMIRKLHTFAGTTIARRLTLALFVVQAVVLACITHIGTPPDETNHIKFIEYYADHSLSPVFTNQQPTYNLGDKTRELDYLYHYVMSLLYRVLPMTPELKYIAIRLCSVAFAVICFILLAKIFRRLGFSEAITAFTLLVLTNLPMVLMMSAAINNDVLVWLGMILGIWLLLRLWQQPKLTDLLWLAALSVTGGLVKRTLIPLGLLFALLGFITGIRHFRTLVAQIMSIRWMLVVSILALVIGSGLFIERAGGNLVHYHTLTPDCEQVQPPDECEVFWLNQRTNYLKTRPTEAPLPPLVFVSKWFGASIYNIVDIQSQNWQHEVVPAFWLVPLLTVLLIIGLVYGLLYELHAYRFTRDPRSRLRLYVMGISIFFLLVHLSINYSTYLQAKFFGLALNGRYIIPSLLPLIGLACYYWQHIVQRRERLITTFGVAVIISVITGSGLLMMVRNPQLRQGDPVPSQGERKYGVG